MSNPRSAEFPSRRRGLTFHGNIGNSTHGLFSRDGEWYVLIPLKMKPHETFGNALKRLFKRRGASR
jgi:hypothetical protein